MKRRLSLPVVCLLSSFFSLAQNARLHVTLSHTTDTAIELRILSRQLNEDLFKKGAFTIPVNKLGSAFFAIPMKEAVSVMLTGGDFNSAGRYFEYTLYLSPGDDLHLAVDFRQEGPKVTVSGKGSQNNAAGLISFPFYQNLSSFNGDTLPFRVMAAIRQQQHANDSVVGSFLTKYHPSPDRIINLRHECAYYGPQSYFEFKENNKYAIQDAYKRNFSTWKNIQDSLFAAIRLDNDTALASNSYLQLIRDFLPREKERLWNEANVNPQKFSREWYDTTATAGMELFHDDMTNNLQTKIIDRNFSGRSAQYLYATLFEGAIQNGNPKNIVSIFERFSQKYPRSEYISWVKPYIDTIKTRQRQTLNDKMIFVRDNGFKLDSFAEVLSMFKGKTVLLDMWGTWCVPCRREIQENSQAIKSYFSGKGLEYLYIANHDQGNEKNWRQLIAYFHLEGTHILANNKLDTDIMTKVKGRGYPTYVIIKKDGSYELSKAGYPMDRQLLIRQLEEALAQ